ncbi:MAG: hypothetical protein VW268_11760 [Rhodospirillaceae bacterium]
MTAITEQSYRTLAEAKGYGDPMQKTWEAGLYNEPHTHDVALYLWIISGDLTLELADDTGALDLTTIGPGETIEVLANLLHTERPGADGVSFLVARK